MITVIAVNDAGESRIRRYMVDDVKTARNSFVNEWIDGEIVWDYFEFYGPNCEVENPAFSPDFLRRAGFDDEPGPVREEGVTIYEWFCAVGPHGSDEHTVTGYFIPSTIPPSDGEFRYPPPRNDYYVMHATDAEHEKKERTRNEQA